MTSENIFYQDIVCPWCRVGMRVDIGPQHVFDDIHVHCQKCSKFSRHKVAAHPSDPDYFVKDRKRREEYKNVWKRIPNDAYLSCHQGTKATPWVFTLYLGGKELPKEYLSHDIVVHVLMNTFGMSERQAKGLVASAVLTPGLRIYLQNHIRVVMAALETEETLQKVAAMPKTKPAFRTGQLVKFNNKVGIFLRHASTDSTNIERSVVAFPTGPDQTFGDVEVPTAELKVVEVGDSDVKEKFQELKQVDNLNVALDILEKNKENLQNAQDIIEDVILEEESEIEDLEKREKKELPKTIVLSEKDMSNKRQADRKKELFAIINDPHVDPDSRAWAQREWVRLTALSPDTPKSREEVQEQKKVLQSIINDPKIDADILRKAQEAYLRLLDFDSKPRTATRRKRADRDAQRRVHTHFNQFKDLPRAIKENADSLSIEDVVSLVRHYVNTGKVEKHVGDKIISEFRGRIKILSSVWDKPAPSSRYTEWLRQKGLPTTKTKPTFEHPDCTCGATYDPYCPAHGAQEHRPRYKAVRSSRVGVFTPATYRGRDVLVIGFSNDGKATVMFGDGIRAVVDVRDLEPR